MRRGARPEVLVQPGHIFPLMAQKGGVLVRAGHTEAGCDLAELAGLTPAAVICDAPLDAVPPPITIAPIGAPWTHPGTATGVEPVK